MGGPRPTAEWCNPHTLASPGRPTMARQDLPPLECRGKRGLDQWSGERRGEVGGPGVGRRMRGGAGGVGTAARGTKHEMSRQESPFSPPCQLISVCCLQLNKACTTFLFRLLPPALTVPSNFQQFVLLLTAHASTSLPTLLMKGKCDRLSALLCPRPPYHFDPHLTRIFANLAVTRHK